MLLYFDVFDFILPEKFKDILGDFIDGVSGDRARIYPNSNYNWTKSFLSVQSDRIIGVACLQTSY